jgi:hypothetical protein
MVLAAATMGLFLHMVFENRSHYRIERVGYLTAARSWNATDWWPKLMRGKVYCAVGMEPMAILLTGPTMSEYTIVERSRRELCPKSSVLLTPATKS